MPATLSETEIRAIEVANPEGLTSAQLIAAFAERDVRFSEATLRKYVQLGLVPRSRRVGTKGKHLGSRGVYPVRAVRRINSIKRLMEDRYTIEEIQAKFLAFKDSIELLDEALGEVTRLFEAKIQAQPPSDARERLLGELEVLRRNASTLLGVVARLEKLILATDRETPRPRGGGVASPTELL